MKEIRAIVPNLGKEELNEISKVIADERISVFSSKKIREFEKAFAKYNNCKHALALNSGTSALHTALLSLNLKKNDEVIVPCFSYMATANAVLNSGAKIKFVDINLKDFSIDTTKIRKAITSKTKVILPVHMFGAPANMKSIEKIAKKRNIKIIEDCAQSLGSKINNKHVGTFGNIGCFSFQESKNITTGGEGGMLVTSDNKIIKTARIIAHEGEVSETNESTTIQGHVHKVNYVLAGHNYRMNAIQAAIGMAQLKKLNNFVSIRRKIAKEYNNALKKYSKYLVLPSLSKENYHSFNNYVVLIKYDRLSRDIVIALLASKGIPAYPYYPNKLTDYSITCKQHKKESYPNTDFFCKNHFTLPIHTKLKDKEVEYISKSIKEIMGGLIKC